MAFMGDHLLPGVDYHQLGMQMVMQDPFPGLGVLNHLRLAILLILGVRVGAPVPIIFRFLHILEVYIDLRFSPNFTSHSAHFGWPFQKLKNINLVTPTDLIAPTGR
jgi:hypothetical protein